MSRSAKTIWLLLLGMLVSAAPLATSESAGQTAVSREYTIKAAYLYNFSRYVRWPDRSFREGDPFVIGVLGTDPFGSNLERIAAAKNVDGRKISIRRFASLDKMTTCHVLFVAASLDPKKQREAIRTLGSSPVLLVGETPGFAKAGGAINFYVEANRTRFEINLDAARRARLEISSKLARTVPPDRVYRKMSSESVSGGTD